LSARCSPVWNWRATVRWRWIRMHIGCLYGLPVARSASTSRTTPRVRRDGRGSRRSSLAGSEGPSARKRTLRAAF
jgi:hypothetical protein